MNVNSKEGRAWVGGKELAGAELKEALERGYGAWVNDTYWLLMPYKMTDPGVTLKYAGEERGANGAMYDKVNLSFDNVGLTPKDTYWVWVNRDTGMVDRWDYVLKGEKAAAHDLDVERLDASTATSCWPASGRTRRRTAS